jgi:hypothetical protein
MTAHSATPLPRGRRSLAARTLLPVRAATRQVTDSQLRAVRTPQLSVTRYH